MAGRCGRRAGRQFERRQRADSPASQPLNYATQFIVVTGERDNQLVPLFRLIVERLEHFVIAADELTWRPANDFLELLRDAVDNQCL